MWLGIPGIRSTRFQLGTAIYSIGRTFSPMCPALGVFQGLFQPPSPRIIRDGFSSLVVTQPPLYKASPHPAGETKLPVGIAPALAYSLLA